MIDFSIFFITGLKSRLWFAEKKFMINKKITVVALGSLFVLQIVAFLSFKNYFEAPGTSEAQVQSLIEKNKKLQTQIEYLVDQNIKIKSKLSTSSKSFESRNIANIDSNHIVDDKKRIDLTEFYFSQLKSFKGKNDKEEFLKMVDQIQSGGVDMQTSARAEYEKVKFLCDAQINLDCTKSVESMITQFPESNWTAKSLLVLSHYYFQQNKIAEAKTLLEIIKNEFKSYDDLAFDLKQMKTEKL